MVKHTTSGSSITVPTGRILGSLKIGVAVQMNLTVWNFPFKIKSMLSLKWSIYWVSF